MRGGARKPKPVYVPVEEESAKEMVRDAMSFFKKQLLEDDEHVEDEYIFDIMKLPKTQA